MCPSPRLNQIAPPGPWVSTHGPALRAVKLHLACLPPGLTRASVPRSTRAGPHRAVRADGHAVRAWSHLVFGNVDHPLLPGGLVAISGRRAGCRPSISDGSWPGRLFVGVFLDHLDTAAAKDHDPGKGGGARPVGHPPGLTGCVPRPSRSAALCVAAPVSSWLGTGWVSGITASDHCQAGVRPSESGRWPHGSTTMTSAASGSRKRARRRCHARARR
jgi:hypothetical protein